MDSNQSSYSYPTKIRNDYNNKGYQGYKNQGNNEYENMNQQFTKLNVSSNKYNSKNYYNNKDIDPYTAQAMIYRAEMYILSKYPNLIDLNKNNEGLSKLVSDKSQYFIIKSFSEEDVHKSIKYNVWSSTKNGNQTLNNAYKMTADKGGFVYLFFSCNGSGRYVGLAKMKSDVNETKQFAYWTQDKWPGMFDVEWLFIKDVPFKNFRHICITMK